MAGVVRVLAPDENRQGLPLSLLERGQGLEAETAIHDWYVLPKPGEVVLPQRLVRLEALSGIESERALLDVDLTGKSEETVNIPVRFFSHISGAGWYGGNTHLHLSKLTKEAAARYLHEIPVSDRLDILFISYLERAVADKDYVTNEYPVGDLKEFWSSGVIVNNGEEHRHNFEPFGEGFGHVMFLNIRELIRPVSLGPGITAQGTDGSPLQAGIEEAHQQGGIAIWCHNHWGLEDVPQFVEGRLDALNIFDGGEHGSYEDSFYHYLNAGLKVPFSTGTDWFMYDFARAYAKVSGELGVKSWLDAVSAGRSFITNGPLFELQAGDKGIGETLDVQNAQEVQLTGRAVGRLAFGNLELIHNGRVRRQLPARPVQGHFEARIDERIRLAEPGWLALRVSTPARNEYGKPLFGHTSPVYVRFGGKSIRMQSEVDYLMAQMTAARETILQKAVFATQQERERVLAVYESALAKLRGKIESTGNGAP